MMLTARSAENDKVMAFESGADDYLTKPFSPRELTVRVGALLRRAMPADEEKIQVLGDAHICHNTFTVKVNEIHLKLQPMEFRFLQFLLTRPNWIFTRSKLIESVWGSRANIDERTVDAHIMRLRKTLHPISHSLKIETVRGEGYRLTSVTGAQA
jgi:two-component system phosphate regulon response regulator PhoB